MILFSITEPGDDKHGEGLVAPEDADLRRGPARS
jgi:hypothetical protein